MVLARQPGTLEVVPGMPQEEVARDWVGRLGWGSLLRWVQVCPFPGNRQGGRSRNRRCIPKVAPAGVVHRLCVADLGEPQLQGTAGRSL